MKSKRSIKTFKSFFTLTALAACVLVFTPMSAQAGDKDDPVIVKAQANSTLSELTIDGTNFGTKTPIVTFNGAGVTVLSHTPTKVVVALPSGIQPGTYLLRISTKSKDKDKDSDNFNVTIGSVGPAGPAGPAGPPGGASRNLSLLGLLRWDLLSPQTFATGSFPRGPTFDRENMWIVNAFSNNVTKLRVSDGACVGTCTFAVGSFPQKSAFDGASVWVSNYFSNTLTKLRASDGACVGTCTFPVGSNPFGLAFDGTNIWVANGSDDTVTKLQASDGACVGTCTFPVGSSPYNVAFDGANIWVTNILSNNVTKLRA
ncbi:MAG TPA: IPT/TIG domain-containing protein, partial [Pyrinomonadaceae bacterium]